MATGGYVTGRLKGVAEVQTDLATIAEFGSSQTSPNGEPNQGLLAAQAPLRLCSGVHSLDSG